METHLYWLIRQTILLTFEVVYMYQKYKEYIYKVWKVESTIFEKLAPLALPNRNWYKYVSHFL